MYVAEYLPRLNQVVIKVDFAELSSDITGVGIRESRLVVQAKSTFAVPLPVPHDSSLEKAKIGGLSVKNDIMSINMAVGAAGSELENSSFMNLSKSDHQMWSVKDLVRKTPRNEQNVNEFSFCCAQCQNVIISSLDLKFMDMPSEFWYEMMDFWHCHKPHEEHHNHNDKNYNGKLTPTKGNVHIGASYILTSDAPTKCPDCSADLGVAEDGSVRLYKWRLLLKYGNTVEMFPPYAFVFYSLLDKVNLSAIRKVSIKSGASSVNVWVSNLGLGVSVTDSPVLTNAMKILYAENPQQLEDEVLDAPSDVYDSFIHHINLLNSRLPQGSKTLHMSEDDTGGNYSIAYLLAQ